MNSTQKDKYYPGASGTEKCDITPGNTLKTTMQLKKNIRINIDEDISGELEEDLKPTLKNLIRVGFEKLGFYLRSNHIILSKRNKLNRIASSIHQGLPLVKRQVAESKHVMFIDQCCGMELELIHTIQVNQTLEERLKNKWASQVNHVTTPYDSGSDLSKMNLKLTPLFRLNGCESSLVKNGICLSSIEVYNHFSIRGIILTLDNATNRIDVSKKDPDNMSHKVTDELVKPKEKMRHRIFDSLKWIFKEKEVIKPNQKLDLVYIIWSVDEWLTFQSQVARQKACKMDSTGTNLIKTHEFFLQNVDMLFDRQQMLQLVVCHQIDETIFYDTNNENCFCFEILSNLSV